MKGRKNKSRAICRPRSRIQESPRKKGDEQSVNERMHADFLCVLVNSRGPLCVTICCGQAAWCMLIFLLLCVKCSFAAFRGAGAGLLRDNRHVRNGQGEEIPGWHSLPVCALISSVRPSRGKSEFVRCETVDNATGTRQQVVSSSASRQMREPHVSQHARPGSLPKTMSYTSCVSCMRVYAC